MQKITIKKKLVIRLSSLGDLILASSVLEVEKFLGKQGLDEIHWLVFQEYAEIFENHPHLKKVILFDRKQGLWGWILLSRQIWNTQYHEVFDLHTKLRSKIMRFLFFIWSILSLNGKNSKKLPTWTTVSKQKFRLLGYFLFKKNWPKAWLPDPWVKRFSHLVGGSGLERPNLNYLIKKKRVTLFLDSLEWKINKGDFFCVMPSSRWHGKNWLVENYVEVLQKFGKYFIVLGKKEDHASSTLVKKLSEAQVSYFSGIGKWNFLEMANVLSQARFYFGGDTGLAHLAEAVGTPAYVLYGPTTPEMGFGPWRKQSFVFGADLWCRPCRGEGHYCFRISKKYLCQTKLTSQSVLEELKRLDTCTSRRFR